MAVAILAGGESRRMGRDKAALPWDGETLLARTARAAWATGLPVMVVGRPQPEGWPLLGVTFLPDETAGLGPLGGLATALRHAESILALACDMPRLTPDALRWLLANASLEPGRGVAVIREGRAEPLFSVYPSSCRPLVARQIESGRRSLTALIEIGNFVRLAAPPEVAAQLAGANTPEEFAALRARE